MDMIPNLLISEDTQVIGKWSNWVCNLARIKIFITMETKLDSYCKPVDKHTSQWFGSFCSNLALAQNSEVKRAPNTDPKTLAPLQCKDFCWVKLVGEANTALHIIYDQ